MPQAQVPSCKPCEGLGWTVPAPYSVKPDEGPAVPQCWFHFRGQRPQSLELACRAIEKTKTGDVPAGICGLPNCPNPRRSNDTTGMCRPHKIECGLAAGKPPRVIDARSIEPKVAQVTSAQESQFMRHVFEMLPIERQLLAFKNAWEKIPVGIRDQIVREAVLQSATDGNGNGKTPAVTPGRAASPLGVPIPQ